MSNMTITFTNIMFLRPGNGGIAVSESKCACCLVTLE